MSTEYLKKMVPLVNLFAFNGCDSGENLLPAMELLVGLQRLTSGILLFDFQVSQLLRFCRGIEPLFPGKGRACCHYTNLLLFTVLDESSNGSSLYLRCITYTSLKLVPRLGFSPMILAHPREIVLSSSVEVIDTEDDKALQRFLILL